MYRIGPSIHMWYLEDTVSRTLGTTHTAPALRCFPSLSSLGELGTDWRIKGQLVLLGGHTSPSRGYTGRSRKLLRRSTTYTAPPATPHNSRQHHARRGWGTIPWLRQDLRLEFLMASWSSPETLLENGAKLEDGKARHGKKPSLMKWSMWVKLCLKTFCPWILPFPRNSLFIFIFNSRNKQPQATKKKMGQEAEPKGLPF